MGNSSSLVNARDNSFQAELPLVLNTIRNETSVCVSLYSASEHIDEADDERTHAIVAVASR